MSDLRRRQYAAVPTKPIRLTNVAAQKGTPRESGNHYVTATIVDTRAGLAWFVLDEVNIQFA
jgi:hypothetical protein